VGELPVGRVSYSYTLRKYGTAGFDRLRHVTVSSGPGVEPVRIDAQSECGGTSLLP
jgi:hypothetical protein